MYVHHDSLTNYDLNSGSHANPRLESGAQSSTAHHPSSQTSHMALSVSSFPTPASIQQKRGKVHPRNFFQRWPSKSSLFDTDPSYDHPHYYAAISPPSSSDTSSSLSSPTNHDVVQRSQLWPKKHTVRPSTETIIPGSEVQQPDLKQRPKLPPLRIPDPTTPSHTFALADLRTPVRRDISTKESIRLLGLSQPIPDAYPLIAGARGRTEEENIMRCNPVEMATGGSCLGEPTGSSHSLPLWALERSKESTVTSVWDSLNLTTTPGGHRRPLPPIPSPTYSVPKLPSPPMRHLRTESPVIISPSHSGSLFTTGGSPFRNLKSNIPLSRSQFPTARHERSCSSRRDRDHSFRSDQSSVSSIPASSPPSLLFDEVEVTGPPVLSLLDVGPSLSTLFPSFDSALCISSPSRSDMHESFHQVSPPTTASEFGSDVVFASSPLISHLCWPPRVSSLCSPSIHQESGEFSSPVSLPEHDYVIIGNADHLSVPLSPEPHAGMSWHITPYSPESSYERTPLEAWKGPSQNDSRLPQTKHSMLRRRSTSRIHNKLRKTERFVKHRNVSSPDVLGTMALDVWETHRKKIRKKRAARIWTAIGVEELYSMEESRPRIPWVDKEVVVTMNHPGGRRDQWEEKAVADVIPQLRELKVSPSLRR